MVSAPALHAQVAALGTREQNLPSSWEWDFQLEMREQGR